MSKLKLLNDDDPFLRKKMPLYTGDYSDLKELVNPLFNFMRQCKGLGLAAPQIGMEKNFFLMETDEVQRFVVNPVIIYESDVKCLYREGCLSFPKLFLTIERSEFIIVDYQDENGKYHTETLKGISARCFQHENDHLNGVVFTKYKGTE